MPVRCRVVVFPVARHREEMELLKCEMDEERERQLKQCREVGTCVLTVCVGVLRRGISHLVALQKFIEQRRRIDKANANTLKKLRLSYTTQVCAELFPPCATREYLANAIGVPPCVQITTLKQMLADESSRLAAARDEVVKLTNARTVDENAVKNMVSLAQYDRVGCAANGGVTGWWGSIHEPHRTGYQALRAVETAEAGRAAAEAMCLKLGDKQRLDATAMEAVSSEAETLKQVLHGCRCGLHAPRHNVT